VAEFVEPKKHRSTPPRFDPARIRARLKAISSKLPSLSLSANSTRPCSDLLKALDDSVAANPTESDAFSKSFWAQWRALRHALDTLVQSNNIPAVLGFCRSQLSTTEQTIRRSSTKVPPDVYVADDVTAVLNKFALIYPLLAASESLELGRIVQLVKSITITITKRHRGFFTTTAELQFCQNNLQRIQHSLQGIVDRDSAKTAIRSEVKTAQTLFKRMISEERVIPRDAVSISSSSSTTTVSEPKPVRLRRLPKYPEVAFVHPTAVPLVPTRRSVTPPSAGRKRARRTAPPKPPPERKKPARPRSDDLSDGCSYNESSDTPYPSEADGGFGEERAGTDLMNWESEVSIGFDEDVPGFRRVPLPPPEYDDSYSDSDAGPPLRIPIAAKPAPAFESYDYYSEPPS
jgi:hypothetical protein